MSPRSALALDLPSPRRSTQPLPRRLGTRRRSSRVPLGFAGADTNLYRYVFNQPTVATDPLGLKLVVNGETITPESDLYKKYKDNAFAREILDTLINYKGTVSFATVEKFENELKIRQAFAKCLEDLQKAGVRFNGNQTTPKDSGWKVVKDKYVKDGRTYTVYRFVYEGDKSPSAALDALVNSGTAFDCANAALFCELRALRDALGPKAFNDLYQGKTLQFGYGENGALPHPGAGALPGALLPGDRVYFPNVSNYARIIPGGPWRGENAIYIGKNDKGEPLFRGFGIDKLFTEAEIRQRLADEYNAVVDRYNKKFNQNLPKITAKDIPPMRVSGGPSPNFVPK
jgi:hypothetical protein